MLLEIFDGEKKKANKRDIGIKGKSIYEQQRVILPSGLQTPPVIAQYKSADPPMTGPKAKPASADTAASFPFSAKSLSYAGLASTVDTPIHCPTRGRAVIVMIERS